MKNFKLSAKFIFKIYYMYVCRSIDKTTPCKGYTQGRRKKNLIVADFLTPLHPYGKNWFIVDTVFFLDLHCILIDSEWSKTRMILREKIKITLIKSFRIHIRFRKVCIFFSFTKKHIFRCGHLLRLRPDMYSTIRCFYAFPQR